MLSSAPEAHLVLGLGGLGIQVVSRVPTLLERHPGQTEPVLFGGLDTCLEAPENPVRREGLELFLLPLKDQSEAIRDPERVPTTSLWLPSGLPTDPNEAGTRGIRALGRLAFTLNVRPLEEWLQGQILTLFNGPELPANLQVHLVAALGGGTGGALLVETAYTLQRLVAGRLPMTVRALVLVRPKGRVDERASANLYASLTELNHFQAPDTNFQFHYSSGQVFETSRAPFEQVYMFACNDPEEPAELDSTVAQVASHLGVGLWTEYDVVNKEVHKRQEVLFRDPDTRGNPASYFVEGMALLVLPFEEVRWTLATRLARQVVARWRELLFRVESDRRPRADACVGSRLLKTQRLNLEAVLDTLEVPLPDPQGVPFRPGDRLEEVRKALVKGGAPASSLAVLDQQLLEQTGPDGSWGVSERLTERGSELLSRGQAEIARELSSFFAPGEEDFASFCRLLEELTGLLSGSVQVLYEKLNLKEVEGIRLSESRQEMLVRLPAAGRSALARAFQKGRLDEPIELFLETAARYYDNRLSILVHRAALNVFLGLMQTIEQFSAGVRELQAYLQELELDLAEEEAGAFRRIFAMPGEVLLSPAEVEAFLVAQSGPEAVEGATEGILNSLGHDLFEIPRALDRAEALKRMVAVLSETMGRARQADVVEQFLARYPGDIARDQLRILFERARPGLAVTAQLAGYYPPAQPSAVYIGVHAGTETSLLPLLKGLPGEVPLTVLPLMTRERLAILRLSGGLPLRAFDLEEAQRAYLQELRLGRFPLHSRRDVRWHALSRPSHEEQQQLYSRVAVALHLGHLDPGTRAQTAGWPLNRELPYGVEALSSPRWPDMGSVKRCLELYDSFHEALWVEQSLVGALIRWQEERLDEVGAEAYLKLLTQGGPALELLGMSLEVDLNRARDLLLARSEEQWPVWDGVVKRALAKAPMVAESDLVSIPKGFRCWAMQRYVELHPEENLAYHPASARLELVSARDLAQFDTLWRRVVEASEGDPTTFGDQAGDLIRLLCHNLGFTPQESLALGPLRGLKVETHGLRVKIPRVIPVLVSQKALLSAEDIEQLRSLMEQAGQTTRFGLLIVMGEVERNVSLLDDKLRSLLRYDVIALGPDELREILRVRHRLSALVGKILEQVDLTVVSPFVTEGPVSASMFFGREGDIKEILYRLERGSVALLGPRRIGKTSIVQRVLASQRAAGHPLIYMDCQAVTTPRDLLSMLADQYLNQKTYDTEEPSAALRRMLGDLKTMYAGRKLYLVLDEIDLFLTQPDSAVLMRVFRAAAAEGTADFLLCGERTLERRISESDSPLSNFCHPIRVQFLPPRDAAKLISEPLEQMEIRWADKDASLERIIDFTGGHPNLIQRVCSALIERLNEERGRIIQPDMVEEVLLGPQLEEYLDTLWGSSTYLEKIITLSIEGGESLTAQDVKRRLEQYEVEASLSNVVSALDDLCLFGLLKRQGTRHTFRVESFPVMVREALDISEAIELYKELMLYGS